MKEQTESGPPRLVRLTDYVGNAPLVELFRRSELPPSSLFAGPEGVGKKTLALSLAARAQCVNLSDSGFCGRCSSCVKIAAGNHPDTVIVDFAWIESFLKSRGKRANPRVIPIDVIREIVREAQFRPFQGQTRLFVVDEAHKLNEAAANALLKTLEEPPPSTKIVLITPLSQSLLPTIRSRCQIFHFSSVSRAEILGYLRKHRPEDAQAELRAAISGGSVGGALSLDLEQLLKDRDELLRLLQKWWKVRRFTTIYRVLEKSDIGKDLRDRERTLDLLVGFQRILEDVYYLQVGTPERVVNIDRRSELGALAEATSLAWIRSTLSHLRHAIEDVQAYVNSMVCFETLWLLMETDSFGTNTGQVQRQ